MSPLFGGRSINHRPMPHCIINKRIHSGQAVTGEQHSGKTRIMVRRTKEEAAETRNSILDAAERVFFEKGVSRTTLADIALEAGVTRGAIYWHFANKGD